MYRPTQESGSPSSAVPSGALVLETLIDRGVEHPPPSTLPTLHLFLHAAFAARPPAELDGPARQAVAQFGVGAIHQAAVLDRLTAHQTRTLTRTMLRWSFGVGHLRAWQWERELRRQALAAAGRSARHEGCISLLAWLRGEDPAQRLSRMLAPLDLPSSPRERSAGRGRVRPLPARAH